MELDGLPSVVVHLSQRLLWPWPLTFWPQKLTSTSINQNTSVTKIGWNSLHWFLRYGVHKVFGTHRLTHSRTDRPEYRMPPVPFFNGGPGNTNSLGIITDLWLFHNSCVGWYNDLWIIREMPACRRAYSCATASQTNYCYVWNSLSRRRPIADGFALASPW